MAKKRQIAYWCFLLTFLFMAALAGAVGQTQSRRINTVVWNTFAEPGTAVVTSDCLQSVSDVPLTVLLGEMNQSNQRTDAAATEIPFVLESNKGLSGKLTWSVDHPDYVDVQMCIGSTEVQQGGIVGLSPDVPVTVIMTLTATEKALSEARGALTVCVDVNWADMMKGTFQVILPAVAVEELPEDDTTGGDETTDGDETTGGDDTTGGDETTGGDDTTGGDETTGEDDTTSEDETTGSDETTDGDETTGEDDTTQEENPENDTEQTQTNDEAAAIVFDTAQQAVVQTVDTGENVKMETLQAFSSATTLPIKITTSEQVDRVQLGVVPTAENETQLGKLPRYTRFSLDNGESYYMLYHDGIMEWDPAPGQQLVLVDFSDGSLGESLDLRIDAYSGETQVGSCNVSTAPSIDQICQMSARILPENGTLQVQTTSLWEDYPFSYDVYKLVMETTEDGEEYKTYVEVSPEDESLLVEQEGTVLTIRTGEQLPEPGTYKVCMGWMYEDIQFGQTEAAFFVNYSTESGTDDEETDTQQEEIEQTGGAEQ